MAITSRGVEPMAASARTNSSTVAPSFNTTLRAFSSLAVVLVCGTTSVVPCERGAGCETARAGLDFHVEIAVQDGDRRDANVFAQDDRAGALVDDYARGPVRFDQKVFQYRT